MVLQACKENEERVKSVGINPFKVKLLAFVISGAITGLAGSLYTDLNRFVSPSVLSWQMSGEIMVLVILGGVAKLYGPILGAIFYIILEQTLGGISENWQFWLGFIIILEVLFAKAGIMSFLLKKELILGSPILKIDNLTKSFGAVKASQNITFELYENEIHALIGSNGAGKSTIIKLITGFLTQNLEIFF